MRSGPCAERETLEKMRQLHWELRDGFSGVGTFEGWFACRRNGAVLRMKSAIGDGWEHVSVSLVNRCPTWDEMCFVKDLFWSPEETVVQYHPRASEYVNNHPYCLHLWRPIGVGLPLPPPGLV